MKYALIFGFLGSALCLSTPSFSQDTIFWRAHEPITWADFQAPPIASSPFDAITSAGIYYTLTYTQTSCQTHIYCYFLKSRSWAKAKDRASLLKHEQGHFDITELFARKLRKAFAAYAFHFATVTADLRQIFTTINDEKSHMNQQYDQETNYSTNAAQQQRWNKKIALALAKP
jgi:hypothetical protein